MTGGETVVEEGTENEDPRAAWSMAGLFRRAARSAERDTGVELGRTMMFEGRNPERVSGSVIVGVTASF